MKIIGFSINKPVTIFMIFLATVVFGFVSLSRLRIKLLPDISYPTLTVQTEYPDAAPVEVENFVTRPLEEAVGVVNGLRHMSSVSKPGMSEITLEFVWKTPMNYAALDVREKIDLVELPRECEAPVILRYDPSLDPIMRIGVYGTNNLVKLRDLADRIIKKDLESLEGVASAKVFGGLEEEVQVELDEKKLAMYQVPIELVGDRLFQDNINQSGGKLRDKGSEFLLRTENEFKNVAEIRNTIIQEQMGKRIILADLGQVWRGYKEREVITRLNGTEAVEVAIYKEGDANTVSVAREIRDRLRVLENQLPKGIEMRPLFDQAQFIEKAIGEVKLNALLGAILAIIVLFLFLRDLRSTFIIGLSIPISVLATFVLMRQMGVSLNLMSLGGIALGVGMLVDNSIVVLESISRHREAGEERKDATFIGASEVGRAVIASTLTTVAVFLPIVFVEGMAGQVFKDQALTVSISLLASLLVALMLIPMISALRLGSADESFSGPAAEKAGEVPPRKRSWFIRIFVVSGRFLFRTIPIYVIKFFRLCVRITAAIGTFLTRPVLRLFEHAYQALENRYPPMLRWTLGHKGVFLASVLLLFAVTLLMIQHVGKELIPPFSQGEYSFNVQLQEGSPLHATDAKLSDMEEIIKSKPEIETYFASIGMSSRLGSNVKSKDKNIGQINIVMKNRSDKKGEERTIQELRREFETIEGIRVKFARPMYFTFQTPVEVNIFGYNLDELKSVSEQIEQKMTRIPGLKDVKSTMELGNPELNVVFDREKLSSYGLTLESVSNILKNKIYGEVPTKLREMEREVDIRVRTTAWKAQDVDMLNSLVVGEREGTPIFLGSVADVSYGRGLSQITRIAQQRAAVVSANISGRDLGSVSREITSGLRALSIPASVNVELGGQNEELLRSFRNLMFALLLAVFLVYLVMASQFESFVHPFIIMFTVPMGIIGVIWTLLLTGKSISIVVLIGAIMLSGIVVNNGIVLIDYINTLRKRGMDKYDAIMEGGKVRFRPILMTTMTTVLGLLPLALGFGEGAEIRAPMALAVIGGLLGATFLTLLVVPTVYAILDRTR